MDKELPCLLNTGSSPWAAKRGTSSRGASVVVPANAS